MFAVAVSGREVDIANQQAKGYRWQYYGATEPDSQGCLPVTSAPIEKSLLIGCLMVRRK